MTVAVVIPVANRPEMLARALRSVQAQTVRADQVVVVDDASVDETPDVARSFGVQLVQRSVSTGSGAARNTGIAAVSADWVAFLDSDDEWLPDHLERLLAQANGMVLVTAPSVTTAGRLMGNPWRRSVRLNPRRLLVPGNIITTSGTMVRTDTLRAVGAFGDLRRAQDLDLWIRVLNRGAGVALARPTVRYHQHGEQASVDRALTASCFDQIIDSCSGSRWMTPRTRTRAYARVRWDGFRTALRESHPDQARDDLMWLVRRPITWPVLLHLFAERRASRFLTGDMRIKPVEKSC